MEKTRESVFETNSSSVHAFVISKSGDYEAKGEVSFRCEDFGWEKRTFRSTSDKASYVFVYVIDECYYGEEISCSIAEEIVRRLSMWIEEEGCSVAFDVNGKELETAEEAFRELDKMYKSDEFSLPSIDHFSDAKEFIGEVTKSKEDFIEWLFNKNSVFMTGNDNSNEDVPYVSREEAEKSRGFVMYK